MKVTAMAEKYISTAKVIDGILILSLPDAISPVVWQMELGQSKSSALEIRNGDNGQFILTLKTPRQDVLEIAAYANRDQAIKALLVTSSALEKAQGQLKVMPANTNSNSNSNGYPVPAVTYAKAGSGLLKKFLTILGMTFASIVALVLVIFIAGKILLSTPSTPAPGSNSAPVSADEFLENR